MDATGGGLTMLEIPASPGAGRDSSSDVVMAAAAKSSRSSSPNTICLGPSRWHPTTMRRPSTRKVSAGAAGRMTCAAG